jgi:membrane-bound lytic murein transglycosylase D
LTTKNNIRSPFLKFILRSASFILFLIIFGIVIQLFSFFKTHTVADNAENVQQVLAFRAPTIPEKLEFAGETVPIGNFDVWESFDRELLVNTYWHSQTILFIKRANRFFPVIEPILQEYGIPDDFKYLALAESGLTNAVSPAGAVGFWQFLRGTAIDYGLEVNDEVDERYHLEKSTVAACRFLMESYSKYGSWAMAAASYNAGRRGMDNQIGIQKEKDYYDLLLNEETQRYVFRILAIKVILENPFEYGFFISEQDLYPPVSFIEIEVKSAVPDFADFAKEFNTNYKLVKFLNPWLRKPNLTNRSGKTYYIRLPAEGARNRAGYFETEIYIQDIEN